MISILFAVISWFLIGNLVRKPSEREAILKKYKSGTREHQIYSRLYTREFLVISIILSVSFTLQAMMAVYGLIVGNIPDAMKVAFFVINMPLNGVAIYMLYKLYRKPGLQ